MFRRYKHDRCKWKWTFTTSTNDHDCWHLQITIHRLYLVQLHSASDVSKICCWRVRTYFEYVRRDWLRLFRDQSSHLFVSYQTSLHWYKRAPLPSILPVVQDLSNSRIKKLTASYPVDRIRDHKLYIIGAWPQRPKTELTSAAVFVQ